MPFIDNLTYKIPLLHNKNKNKTTKIFIFALV